MELLAGACCARSFARLAKRRVLSHVFSEGFMLRMESNLQGAIVPDVIPAHRHSALGHEDAPKRDSLERHLERLNRCELVVGKRHLPMLH